LTSAQLEPFLNVDKLESKMTLDQEEYLHGENARITVTLRNPTSAPLQIPEPFHQLTGACYMLRKGVVGPDLYGDEKWVPKALTPRRRDAPTIILAPGQEITGTVSTKDGSAWGGQFRIPDQPGEWRMKYAYDNRIGADFKMVRPTKLWAISILHLRPSEEMEYGKLTVRSSVVPFLAIETLPGEHWLFRGDPLREELSPWPLQEYTLRVLGQIRFFERVQRLEEPVRSLQTQLRADDTVDVKVEAASGRVRWLNVPSAPARTAGAVR
jgi:hypothetical protein